MYFLYVFILVLAVMFSLAIRNSFTKGEISDKHIAFIIDKLGKDYKLINNIQLDDKITIQNLIISKNGIFILNQQDFKGKVFGTENSKYWSVKNFGHDRFFENPLEQIQIQKDALQKVINIEENRIFCVVVFPNSAKLKFSNKNVVNLSKLEELIKSYDCEFFTTDEIHEIQKQLTLVELR